ncbi:MAG: lipopolysaccharide biosynthesis protein [Pirellulaceae bacterium]
MMSGWAQVRVWSLRLIEFGLVQAGVQLLNAVAGLVIIRSLPKSEYALFAVTGSIQAVCNMLGELGIGVGVLAIGGRVWSDPQRFGSLIATATELRVRFSLVSVIICLPVAMWMLWRNEASPAAMAALSGVILFGMLPLMSSSIYLVVPQLHGEYRRIQKLDFGNALFRCAIIGGLALGALSAVSAALVGALTIWIHWGVVRRWAAEQANLGAPPNSEDRGELLRLSFRSLPNVVFFCLQGQVTLLLLTWAGQPSSVADVTALGRLAALLSVFSTAFSVVLTPRFCRCQDAARLPQLYLKLITGTVAVVVPLMVASWVFPKPFLWLLGSKYASLEAECGWVVTAVCVSQVGAAMWALNISKAWIRYQAALYIPVILSAQIVAALLLNLRRVDDVLVFNLVTAAAPLPIYIIDAISGLSRRGLQVADSSHRKGGGNNGHAMLTPPQAVAKDMG